MRYRCAVSIAVLTLSVVVMFSTCGDPGSGDVPQEPPYLFFNDPPSTSDDCCGVTYIDRISGNAPPDGAYYWSALLRGDSIMFRSEAVWVPGGEFQNVPVYMAIVSSDAIEPGEYVRNLHCVTDPSEFGIEAASLMTTTVGVYPLSSLGDSICATCCTRDSLDPDGSHSRRHCVGAKDIGQVVGVKAEIRTMWGTLCGAGTSTEQAQYNAYVGIQNGYLLKEKPTAWAQFGYMDYRSQGATDNLKFLYVEYKDSADVRPSFLPFIGQFDIPVPDEGSDNKYEVVRNGTNDGWEIYYKDVKLVDVFSSGWQAYQGRWAMWATEILKRETDMPGSRENPCVFQNCQYKKSGNPYFGADFRSSDIVACSHIPGNPRQWDCKAEGDKVMMWDEHRLSD